MIICAALLLGNGVGGMDLSNAALSSRGDRKSHRHLHRDFHASASLKALGTCLQGHIPHTEAVAMLGKLNSPFLQQWHDLGDRIIALPMPWQR